MTQSEINSQLEKCSDLYVSAIAAKLNYRYQKTSKDFDEIGIDCMIHNHQGGISRQIESMANLINIQLKGTSISSTTMFRETDEYVEYNLTNPVTPITPHYLVVVVAKEVENIGQWIDVSNLEEIIVRLRGYYYKIENRKSGWIRIEKDKTFCIDNLPNLFINQDPLEIY
jgi:hypothetical protein